MFGLNENTQYYVCQRYVRMNMGINGCENRDGTSATWWCGIHLLLQEPPAGKNALLGSLGLMALFCMLLYLLLLLLLLFLSFPALRIG